jgi:UDP-N-acetylglucosamine 4,6-dehydratase
MERISNLFGRPEGMFAGDLADNKAELCSRVKGASFLVLGAAGTIGQAVTREILTRNPRKLHAVDISENNMVELVRDIRSSIGYIKGEFRTFALDIGSLEFNAFMQADGEYDYVLNLSAMKHVRSEKDPFTLMRMVCVNIMNTEKVLLEAKRLKTEKFFCVSTDKAANPANMMGASKKIMELFLLRGSVEIPISTARFANVAFSDGSLLHGFHQRLAKNQPISAPNDIKRYFVTKEEAGQLCLLSCLLGNNRDTFFPKLSVSKHLVSFASIAQQFLLNRGYEPYLCETEQEARELASSITNDGKWPCYFFESDTTGEKPFEEFYTGSERLDMDRFESIGVILNDPRFDSDKLNGFMAQVEQYREQGEWKKEDLVSLFKTLLPEFGHVETGKNLDGKM